MTGVQWGQARRTNFGHLKHPKWNREIKNRSFLCLFQKLPVCICLTVRSLWNPKNYWHHPLNEHLCQSECSRYSSGIFSRYYKLSTIQKMSDRLSGFSIYTIFGKMCFPSNVKNSIYYGSPVACPFKFHFFHSKKSNNKQVY